MDLISEGNSILLLHSNENIKENIINKFNDIKANFNNITFVAESFKEREEKKNLDKAKFDIIICTTINFIDDNGMIKIILEVLKPNGIFELHSITSNATAESTKKHLKLSGFIEIQDSTDNAILCKKPNYEIGSSVKLLLKPQPPKSTNNVAAVWTINGDDDDDDDYNNIIDADDLLDDIDKQKPDPLTLKVCSTTGKRKACKDCSCGLAEELYNENSDSDNIKESKNKNELKSSCGSCYLGDAFRCASCPYLGMPAFKPGEKIQLSDDLLKSDI